MASDQEWIKQNKGFLIPFLYLFCRIILFLSLVPYGYYGIGDLQVYREWTSLTGWPYLNYWVEYPPLFPFLSEGLYRLSAGQDFLYDFLIALVLALAGAASLYYFYRIAREVHDEQSSRIRTLVLFGVMVTLPYTWWYADSITLFFMMAGIWAIVTQKDHLAGIWIGLGVLAKWFPLFLLPALFRQRSIKRIMVIGSIALLLAGVIWLVLFVVSPDMTRAALLSQLGRSSWQTVWALIDGNMTTGAYLTIEQRLDPSQSMVSTGNPPVIPPLLTLLIFSMIGIAILIRRSQPTSFNYISNIGVIWLLFLLWSPGWSSQWVLYLLPLVLLLLPIGKGVLLCLGLVMVNVIEFPFLLGRHLTDSLWVLIPVRVLMLVILLAYWLFPDKR